MKGAIGEGPWANSEETVWVTASGRTANGIALTGCPACLNVNGAGCADQQGASPMTDPTTPPPVAQTLDCECQSWCREYGVGRPGEEHHRNCKRWCERLGTAYRTKTELIVVGEPESDEEGHNCDAMGCSSVSHVVYRSALAGEAPKVPAGFALVPIEPWALSKRLTEM
jgi:hypothetical protein